MCGDDLRILVFVDFCCLFCYRLGVLEVEFEVGVRVCVIIEEVFFGGNGRK